MGMVLLLINVIVTAVNSIATNLNTDRESWGGEE